MVNVNWKDIENDIFPLVIVDEGKDPDVLSYQGTGFLIRKDTLLTCFHCVSSVLKDDQYYAAAIKSGDNYRAYRLHNIRQDKKGRDIAIANINHSQKIGIGLSDTGAPAGSEVVIFGYPYTDKKLTFDGTLEYELNPRFLKTYITRAFWHNHLTYGKTMSYEVGIPAPRGLSGSPIIDNKKKRIFGMVYGNLDVETIEDYKHINTKTGEKEVEVRRIVSFGLAHHTQNLLEVLEENA